MSGHNRRYKEIDDDKMNKTQKNRNSKSKKLLELEKQVTLEKMIGNIIANISLTNTWYLTTKQIYRNSLCIRFR